VISISFLLLKMKHHSVQEYQGKKNPRAEIEMRYQAGRRTFKIGEDVSTTKYYN